MNSNKNRLAQTKTRKVNIIEIDLTNSSNKVEDFCTRVKSSANNIDKFPDAEILVSFNKWTISGNKRSVIRKFSLLQDKMDVSVLEGDKRKRECYGNSSINLGSISGLKSDWLLENAKKTIVAMALFHGSFNSPMDRYSESLGVTKEEFFKYLKVFSPQAAKKVELDDAIEAATNEVMETVKGLMVEGEHVDDFNVLKVNNGGMAIEYEDGRFRGVEWDETSFFIPLKDEIDDVIRRFIAGKESKNSSWLNGDNVIISLVRGKSKNTVVLTVAKMSETFKAEDYASIYMWVYENRHELVKPKEEILTYVGLYGSDKVENVVSIAKDVLTPGVQFVRDNRTYLVVYRDDIGVTLHETTSVVTGGSPFNNTHVVSYDWNDFSNWNHMPTDDMCTINKQWRVKDGVATLVEEPVSDNTYSKVA